MNTTFQALLAVLALFANAIAAEPHRSDDRIAYALFAGAAVGTVIGLGVAEKESKRRLVTRSVISLFTGPGATVTIDHYVTWIDLSSIPNLALIFFGTISAISLFFIGYAGVKVAYTHEDAIAQEQLKQTFKLKAQANEEEDQKP